MRMGFAETDITPEKSVTMVGFARDDEMSKGILDRLMAQVSVWESDDICCLAAIDSIGFNKREADLLRARIGAVIGASAEKVMLAFSHTHAAVNVAVEKEYYEMICQRICAATVKAKTNMSEVSVGWSNVEADIGNNRRRSSNVVDRRVGILKVCSDDEGLRLIILRLTAHCNVLKGDNYLISADYFGAVRRVFGQKYHCPIMVIQGSAGNIAPKYYKASFTPIDGQGEQYVNCDTALDDMAHQTLSKVETLFDEISVAVDRKVRAYSKYLPLRSKIPSMTEAHKIADDALKYCNIDGRKWLKEVDRQLKNGVMFQEERLELQYFYIGDWCLCGIPNETMTEFALETQRRLNDQFFYFNGYTNGCGSYFPTKEEYDIGGYEVYWAMLIYFDDYGRLYPYERGSVDTVISFAVENAMRRR